MPQDVLIKPVFDSWRAAARRLLQEQVAPHEVMWLTESDNELSLYPKPAPNPSANASATSLKVPAAFLEIAKNVSCHSDPHRWAVLYRVLYRLTLGDEHDLLGIATDPDRSQLATWEKAISRDVHKMHAFVRFRLTGRDEETGRECYAAWHEPDHHIVKLAAPFFLKRFAAMNWVIFTPGERVSWDGQSLVFGPGTSRTAAPIADELDALWRTYYGSIFNPSRVKMKAMLSQMPKKFWKNLPETSLIEDLVKQSSQRVRTMIATPASAPRPSPRHRPPAMPGAEPPPVEQA